MNPELTSRPTEQRLLVAFFVAALCTHLWLVTFNVKAVFLSGHEFRQSQTALITHYIDQENNFTPFYEQPILGKPWKAFMLEFPLYQWSVVGLSRATGWPHHLAARTISITSFYVMLPALFLLLGRMGLTRPRRLFVLALVLVCPVYIFYTRAFLIDAMASMFSAWFVAGFVRTMDRRSYGWLAVTMLAGTGAALVKSFIYAIWLGPAAAYGAWLLWRDLRPWRGWAAPLRTLAWGAATVALPLGSLKWWLAATDALKEQHASAWIFTSKNLSQGNWGLFNFSTLFSREVWQTLFARWSEAMMQPWLLLALLVVGVAAVPRGRAAAAGLAAVFLLSQALFPFAYAYQDYYYYSCALFAMAALGLLALGLLDTRLPRWLVWPMLAALFVPPLLTYRASYWPQQVVTPPGGTPLTLALRDITPPGSVLVIAGEDWAAMIPYYTQRRALMIRNGLEYDTAYLERAYAELADEDVAALVVARRPREYRPFLDFTFDRLDLERQPALRHPLGDVYVRRIYSRGADTILRNSLRYGAELQRVEPPAEPRSPRPVPAVLGKSAFREFSPAPYLCDLEYGLDWTPLEGPSVISAHADSFLWFHPPEGARHIQMTFGMHSPAWKREGDKTNGVEFRIVGFVEGGEERVVFRRLLTPTEVEADRGVQTAEIDYTPRAGEALRFEALSNGSKAYDWAYWRSITIK